MSTALSIVAFAISLTCFLCAVAAWLLSGYCLYVLKYSEGFTTQTVMGKRIKRRLYVSLAAGVLFGFLMALFGTIMKVV